LGKIENLKVMTKLSSLAKLTSDANRISMVCGWDFVNKREVSGMNRFLAGLSLLKENNVVIDKTVSNKLLISAKITKGKMKIC
jgi:hypothetical protein